MRTTLTLDPDVAALVRKAMRGHGRSLKQVVNDAIRRGLASGREPSAFNTPTFDMGVPAVDLDKALHVAAELEDHDLLRRMGAGR